MRHVDACDKTVLSFQDSVEFQLEISFCQAHDHALILDVEALLHASQYPEQLHLKFWDIFDLLQGRFNLCAVNLTNFYFPFVLVPAIGRLVSVFTAISHLPSNCFVKRALSGSSSFSSILCPNDLLYQRFTA